MRSLRRQALRIVLAAATLAALPALISALLFAAKPGQPPPSPPTPGWDTKASLASDPDFYLPSYPIAFVKAPVVEVDNPVCITNGSSCSDAASAVADCNDPGETLVTRKKGVYHLGTDVLSADDPNPGNELWIFLPSTGGVKKLFPRAVHETQGLIDFAASDGSVVEPNLSEDGTRIYFSYFQDATDSQSTPPTSDGTRVPFSGADLYVIDIGPLLAYPSLTDLDSLIVQRLTSRTYQSSGSRKQLPADRDKDAMNKVLATSTNLFNSTTEYGTVYMHPMEVRTRNGLYLAYVSNKRRLDNSNDQRNRANNNFNLHFAPILSNGTLGPEDNQFQYYTTTSALSPTPLRNGLAFSYQATTEDGRNWHIQGMNSEGYWFPIIGYGSNDQLFHLASLCVANEGGEFKDYLVAAKYYNTNNEGFGSLWKQDLSILGTNTYTTAANLINNNFYVPRQVGATELTAPLPGNQSVPQGGSLSADNPSPKNAGTQLYYGKFTSPRCGGVNELYFSHTPTSANGRLLDPAPECNRHIYHASIGFRPDLEPFVPNNPVANNGSYLVIRRTNGDSNLLWPVPIVPWSVRSHGDATQQYTPESIAQAADVVPGDPGAEVGTSALYNTDRRPAECFIKQGATPIYYTPWGTLGNINEQNDRLTWNQDTWTYVNGPGPGPQQGFCADPPHDQILGIAINMTSNKSNLLFDLGYETSTGGNPQEAVRLLGVYDVRHQNGDQSFKALIPANVPFEFQALDRTYGMKLADVRSWHSLKPREVRTDCGGCHQHEDGRNPVAFGGTYADNNPPVDLLRSTPNVGYDAMCELLTTLVPSTAAALSYPEWRQDIWAGGTMDVYCGECHNTTRATGPPGSSTNGTLALSWSGTTLDDGDAVYDQVVNRRFVGAERGAIGSQLFWAARGRRTDNRSNTAWPSNYGCTTQACNNQPGLRWGYQYNPAHDTKCTTPDTIYADWVFKVGKWIDNHTPRNTGYPSPYPYKFDWYHPTADFVVDSANCSLTSLRVGWWDDSNNSKSIRVLRNDTTALYTNTAAPIANGFAHVSISGVSSTDWITVEVIDAADNRQIYRKRGEQLVSDCDPQ